MNDFRFNRVFSKFLTRWLLKTPLTPNQITALSLGFGLAAGFFFSKGKYGLSLLAAACYELAVVLDNCDGEVARAKNLRSRLGGWLDVTADLLTDFALFTGIAWGMKHQGVAGPVDLFLILCLSGAFFHFLLVIREKIKGFGPAMYQSPHPEHTLRQSRWLSAWDALREGEASWLVMFCALMGWTPAILWVGGFYMQVLWMSALWINYRWLK